MTTRACIIIAAVCGVTSAATAQFDLGGYQYAGQFALPPAASEASAITWNWDTGTLFALGDEGDAIVEVTTTGAVIGAMSLTGFSDTEGLTYIGAGRFVIGEERLQDVYRLTYAGGGSVDRSALPSFDLGPTVGNVGIEGFSFDPRDGSYVAVKEKTPQDALRFTTDFAGVGSVANLFNPAALGVLDLSDVQTLSTVEALVGAAEADNLLIYSQESALLMEVSRSGALLSQFSLAGLSTTAEGVTIDSRGVIYVCDETPVVHVLTPIPGPSSLGLLALAGLVAGRRRR